MKSIEGICLLMQMRLKFQRLPRSQTAIKFEFHSSKMHMVSLQMHECHMQIEMHTEISFISFHSVVICVFDNSHESFIVDVNI